MSKQKESAAAFLKGTGMTLLLYILLQMLLALLAVKGALPEKRLFPAQAVTAVLAMLPGGLYAARRSGLGALPAAMLTALSFAILLSLVGLLVYDGVAQTGQTVVLLLAAAAGGLLAGLLGGGGKKKRKKRPAVRRRS